LCQIGSFEAGENVLKGGLAAVLRQELGYYYAERSYGSFRRDLTLDLEVDTSKIDATCKNGVLTLKLPKSERAKAIKVKVKGQ
jgi:HSP20 family molecular chaperone IbpA